MLYLNRIVVGCVLFFFIPMAALAGSLDDPGAPTTAGGGAMNTLEDIYNLINAGTTNDPRTGTFAEPSAGPASTGHTLTDVYNRAKTSSRPAKTGQTTSSATGDDGNLQKGVAWPSTRFTSNGDGTVTDNLTGLIWLKVANYNSTVGGTGTATWANALNFCNALQDGQCGLSDGSSAGDWRLPNRNELLSLNDLSEANPCLPSGHPFSSVQSSSSYWSSSAYAANTSNAWIVDLDAGNVGFVDKGDTYYVWPVRGGQ